VPENTEEVAEAVVEAAEEVVVEEALEAEAEVFAEDAEAEVFAEDAEAEVFAEDAEAEVLAEDAEAEVLAEDAEAEVLAEDAEARSKVTPAGGAAAAVGRRKEAVARVRIGPGSGEFRINDRTLNEYFPDKVHQQLINSPFAVLGSLDQYDVVATMSGGGTSGQAGALRLAIARALNEINEEAYRPDLKAAGYLSRDSRAKERKKYGLKKARKAPQYSKR
jgi:small subunit ribosomal protein S9